MLARGRIFVVGGGGGGGGGEGGNLHFTFQSINKIFSQDNSMFLEICKIDTHKHNKTIMGSKQY